LWVVVVAVTAAIAALVIGAFVVRGAGGHAGAAAVSSRSGRGPADQVAAALRGLASDPQALVASGAKSEVRGRARQAVPRGSGVVPDVKSWAPDGVGGGSMLVTIKAPGKAPVSYYAIMIREDGQWKVLATIGMPRAALGSGS
jgi:hypothetical protein